MADAHTLWRVVTVAGSVSGGAVLTLEGKTETSKEGLGGVRPLVGLVARTVTSQNTPDEATVRRVSAYLARLTRRYGTVKRALEALAIGRRRHLLISNEDCAAWVEAMSVSEGAIDSTLRRHARLLHAIEAFVEEMGDGLIACLRGYEWWLDAELTGFEDNEEMEADHAAVGGGFARPGSTPRKLAVSDEDRERARALAKAAIASASSSASPRGDEEGGSGVLRMEDSGGAGGLGMRGGRDADMEWAVHGAEAEGAMHTVPEGLQGDAAYLWRSVFDEKPMVDLPGERVLSETQREIAGRLSADPDPFIRAIAAVAMRDFGKADSFLPHLEARSDAWIDSESVAMLRGHRYELEGRHDEAVGQYREAHPDADHPAGRRAIAAALLRARSGSRKARFGEAVRLLRGLMGELDPDTVDAARVRGLLGYALTESPVGSRADNLREAIGLFERALAVIEAESHPVWWAELNYLLGNALLHCPKTPRGEAMPRAIASLECALRVWTRASAPACWAAVQFLLGAAHERNPSGEAHENLERAIGCYHASLGVRQRETHPIGWARLQNAIGNAWLAFGGGDIRQNCERSIAANTGALEIWARESRRGEWAATQMSLGTAWTIMPVPDTTERERNLERAVKCFRAALEERSRESSPDDWASTHHNLGNALLNLAQVHGPREINGALVKEAIECFKRAHAVRTPERNASDWAKTAAALGAAYGVLPIKDRHAALTRAARYLTRAEGVFEKLGDGRHAAHVKKLLEGVRERLDDGGDVVLTDTDAPSVPRRERKLAERGIELDGARDEDPA